MASFKRQRSAKAAPSLFSVGTDAGVLICGGVLALDVARLARVSRAFQALARRALLHARDVHITTPAQLARIARVCPRIRRVLGATAAVPRHEHFALADQPWSFGMQLQFGLVHDWSDIVWYWPDQSDPRTSLVTRGGFALPLIPYFRSHERVLPAAVLGVAYSKLKQLKPLKFLTHMKIRLTTHTYGFKFPKPEDAPQLRTLHISLLYPSPQWEQDMREAGLLDLTNLTTLSIYGSSQRIDVSGPTGEFRPSCLFLICILHRMPKLKTLTLAAATDDFGHTKYSEHVNAVIAAIPASLEALLGLPKWYDDEFMAELQRQRPDLDATEVSVNEPTSHFIAAQKHRYYRAGLSYASPRFNTWATNLYLNYEPPFRHRINKQVLPTFTNLHTLTLNEAVCDESVFSKFPDTFPRLRKLVLLGVIIVEPLCKILQQRCAATPRKSTLKETFVDTIARLTHLHTIVMARSPTERFGECRCELVCSCRENTSQLPTRLGDGWYALKEWVGKRVPQGLLHPKDIAKMIRERNLQYVYVWAGAHFPTFDLFMYVAPDSDATVVLEGVDENKDCDPLHHGFDCQCDFARSVNGMRVGSHPKAPDTYLPENWRFLGNDRGTEPQKLEASVIK